MGVLTFEKLEGTAVLDADRALYIGAGAAAVPMWTAFFASATAVSAWWWSTAWARGEFRPSAEALTFRLPAPVETFAEAVKETVEAFEDVAEAKAACVTEAVEAFEDSIELAAETTAETAGEALDAVAVEFETLAAEFEGPQLEKAIEVPEPETAAAPLEAAAGEVVAEPITAPKPKKKLPKAEA